MAIKVLILEKLFFIDFGFSFSYVEIIDIFWIFDEIGESSNIVITGISTLENR